MTMSAADLVENCSAGMSWDYCQEQGCHGLLSPDPSPYPAAVPTFPKQVVAMNLGALAVENIFRLDLQFDPA